jgi:hypothetical protein
MPASLDEEKSQTKDKPENASAMERKMTNDAAA